MSKPASKPKSKCAECDKSESCHCCCFKCCDKIPLYELWRKFGELETRLKILEETPPPYPSQLPTPDYDSGRNPISGPQTITHNIGTTNILVMLLHSDGTKVRLADEDVMFWYIINDDVMELVMPILAGNYYRLIIWKF